MKEKERVKFYFAKLKTVSWFLLLIYTTCVLTFHFLWNGFVNYYDIRKTVPLILFFYAQVSINFKFRKYLHVIGFATILLFSIFSYRWDWCGGWIWLQSKIGLTWRSWVYIEYIAFGMIYLELLARRLKHDFQALAYTVFLLSIVGFMYEIPVYHSYANPQFFSISSPFFFRTSIIGLCIVCWKLGWKTFSQLRVQIALIFLSIFYLFHFLNPFFAFPYYGFIVRIPTLLFWAFAVYCMKEVES